MQRRSRRRSARWTCTAASPRRPGTTSTRRARSPRKYWNRIAFVNEPTGHVVHRAILEREGRGLRREGRLEPRRERRRVVRAGGRARSDPTAPSGSPTSTTSSSSTTRRRSARSRRTRSERRGNAYENPLREHDARPHLSRSCGRARRRRTRRCRCSANRPDELVQALRNDNMFWRLTAQRLLVERGKTDVVPQLIALVARSHRRRDRAQPRRRARAVDAARPRRARRQRTPPRSTPRCARSRTRRPACARRRSRCCRRPPQRSPTCSRQARSPTRI